MTWNGGTRIVYIGNLPDDIRHLDLRYLFREEEGFGRILRVDIKNGAPGQAYAFLDFENERDAADAVNRRHGLEFEGECLRVELKGGAGKASSGSRHNQDQQHHHHHHVHHLGANTRVVVTGLPHSCSWQDLKDHMREGGDVMFVDIERPGVGIVRYGTHADAQAAVKLLDGSIFADALGDVEIRVRPEEADLGGGCARSRSRRR